MAQAKSPFELRADLLRLSFEILLAEHRAKTINGSNSEFGANTAPSTEEVIEEARKLNDFISKSGADRREK